MAANNFISQGNMPINSNLDNGIVLAPHVGLSTLRLLPVRLSRFLGAQRNNLIRNAVCNCV